ncbi:1879_t:CDS:1, partial [Scutellospora calospora]
DYLDAENLKANIKQARIQKKYKRKKNESDSSLSSLKSNDSNYTKKKKKGKFKAVDYLNTENLKADIEQERIQRNYEELKKNNIEQQDIITNEDLQEEIELDIAEEEIYEEFDRKNKNNPEYKHLKNLIRKL